MLYWEWEIVKLFCVNSLTSRCSGLHTHTSCCTSGSCTGDQWWGDCSSSCSNCSCILHLIICKHIIIIIKAKNTLLNNKFRLCSTSMWLINANVLSLLKVNCNSHTLLHCFAHTDCIVSICPHCLLWTSLSVAADTYKMPPAEKD